MFKLFNDSNVVQVVTTDSDTYSLMPKSTNVVEGKILKTKPDCIKVMEEPIAPSAVKKNK